MIKFFRRIRFDLIEKNPPAGRAGKTTKYFKYAVGEIALVVIGILIALSINNWNENRKESGYLNLVYQQLQKDLKADTLNVSQRIELYTRKNKRLTDIIDRNIPVSFYDTINESNFANCDKCRSDIASADPFQNLNKGYQLLKAMNTDHNNKVDSLSFKIDGFYKTYNEIFPDLNKMLLDLINQEIDDYQQYDWFVEWSLFERRTYNKAFMTYIFESEEYRTKSARHLIYSKYYLNKLKDYNTTATEILELLDEKLKA